MNFEQQNPGELSYTLSKQDLKNRLDSLDGTAQNEPAVGIPYKERLLEELPPMKLVDFGKYAFVVAETCTPDEIEHIRELASKVEQITGLQFSEQDPTVMLVLPRGFGIDGYAGQKAAFNRDSNSLIYSMYGSAKLGPHEMTHAVVDHKRKELGAPISFGHLFLDESIAEYTAFKIVLPSANFFLGAKWLLKNAPFSNLEDKAVHNPLMYIPFGPFLIDLLIEQGGEATIKKLVDAQIACPGDKKTLENIVTIAGFDYALLGKRWETFRTTAIYDSLAQQPDSMQTRLVEKSSLPETVIQALKHTFNTCVENIQNVVDGKAKK